MGCVGCSSNNVRFDRNNGEYVCERCGLILEDDSIDYGDLSFRVGVDGHLSSTVDATRSDGGLGTLLTPLFSRINGIRQFRNNLYRNYAEALPDLKIVWKQLELPDDLRRQSGSLYKMCIDKKLTRGRSRIGMALATAHIVCTTEGLQRDIANTAFILSVPLSEVYSYSKKIRQVTKYSVVKLSVEDHIKKGAKSLSLPADLLEACLGISKTLTDKRLMQDKHRPVVAGAIIYTVCRRKGRDLSQKKVADALGVSNRSIKRVYGGLNVIWTRIS